jgi:REP element-mobilizing transposase RayT
VRHRRAFIPGFWFSNAVTEQRRPIFVSPEAAGVLREAFRAERNKRPFRVEAMVVLPDHLHCIWTLPPEDADFATRWQLIKTWFTKRYDPRCECLRIVYERKRRSRHFGCIDTGSTCCATRPRSTFITIR